MSEFLNRMSAQRALLQAVNSRPWREQLFGMSSQAISRWMVSNRLDSDSEIIGLLREASERLGFLANKSQEQISDDYRRVSQDVEALTRQIDRKLAGIAGD